MTDYGDFLLEENEIEIDTEEVADVFSMDTYYQPVRVGDMGSYGIAELIIKSAEYFDIGDVGNADWMNARTIPFGDYDSAEIGVSGGVVRYADELHWENAPRASETPDEDYIASDPALLWTLEEIEKLEKIGESPRLEKLKEFLVEIKEYDKRQKDDELHLVPEWAVEIIYQAITTGQKYDPEILSENAQPKSLAFRPVGRSPLPSITEVQQYYDISTPVVVRCTSKAWINYLENGEKKYGPAGESLGTTTFLKSPYIENAKEHKEFTDANLVKLCMENGLSVSKDTGEYKVSISNKFETIDEISTAINNIANEVSRSSAILETILDYRKKVLKDLNRETAYKYLTRTKRGSSTLLDICKDVLDVKYFHQMTFKQIINCLDNSEANAFTNYLSSRVNENTYVLQVRNNYGYQPVAYTKDRLVAAKYKTSTSMDICWFLLPAFERHKYTMPSEAGDKLESLRIIKEIESNKYFNSVGWRRYVPYFNAGHNVKTIPSLANREINWMFNQTTMNSKQIKACKDGIYLLGAEYISMNSKRISESEQDRIAFFRIQDKISQMLTKYRDQIPRQLLTKMSTGFVDVYYDFTVKSMKDIPPETLLYYLHNKQITYYEFKSKTYIDTSIKFNYKPKVYTDVFKIVNNYKLNEQNQKQVMELLNERTV